MRPLNEAHSLLEVVGRQLKVLRLRSNDLAVERPKQNENKRHFPASKSAPKDGKPEMAVLAGSDQPVAD